jgi:hypothetical protein
MSSRVAGAGLALIAAALLAVSIATPVVLPPALSLFAGHPTVKEHVRETQDMYVGLYEARLCNSGGDGTCKSGEADRRVFRFIGYGELGATGLGVFSLVLLGVLTLKKSEGRKGAAKLVRIANAIGLAGAVGLIALGPFSAAAIPLGLGMILHGAGLVGGIVASAVAARPPPPLKLRSQPVAVQSPPPHLHGQHPHGAGAHGAHGPAPLDMQAMFSEDQMRPSGLGPESRQRGRRTDPPPYGDHGAADPFAATQSHQSHPGMQAGMQAGMQSGADRPLFSSAPQLRPLYDATPMQGGTGGLMPIERPILPSRAPTPVPRAMYEVDIDVEPSMMAPLPSSPSQAAMPAPMPMPANMAPQQQFQAPPQQQFQAPPQQQFQAPPQQQFQAPPDRIKSKTLPPPSPPPRSKPMTVPPPPGPRSQASYVPSMPDREMSVAASPVPAAPPAFPPPGMSDGRPEAIGSPPNTEPTMFPHLETPLAAPPPPLSAVSSELEQDPFEAAFGTPASPSSPSIDLPTDLPADLAADMVDLPTGAAAPIAGPDHASATPMAVPPSPSPVAQPLPIAPPPALPPPPRAHRESQLPPPRPGRDTQAPKPALRAAVPMPARPGRPAIPTRPPPIAARSGPPKATIAAPVVPPPIIPPIPAMPSVAPAPQTAAQRAPTELVPELVATPARVLVEITDNLSQTNVSDIPTDDHDPGTAPVELEAAEAMFDDAHAAGPHDTADAPIVRPPDSAPSNPTAIAFPVPIAIPSPTAVVRDRPMPKLPISTAPDSLPPPKDTKQQASGPSPACPQCESPMAWVEEHLRFYCKSCRMYF